MRKRNLFGESLLEEENEGIRYRKSPEFRTSHQPSTSKHHSTRPGTGTACLHRFFFIV